MTTSKKSVPLLHKQVPDNEIDYSDIPELTDEFWENCQVVHSKNKESLTLRVDSDVLEWFREQGKGYQTLMNSVLRSYVQHQNTNDSEQQDEAA